MNLRLLLMVAAAFLLPGTLDAQTPPDTTRRPAGDTAHSHPEEVMEGEEVVVSITRGDRRIEDEAIRVEVVGREEIEEKMLMRPGTVAMLLSETAGLRVQESAPALGGSTVRIQGLRGRYTRILADGLPLYGGQTGSLGLLQIPPMDLRQVEIIKGAASALYGASALGGVVNLVSRRPAPGNRELLMNATTRGGTDVLGWASDTWSDDWGYTVLGGLHAQPDTDVDNDGWADMARIRRATVRPRVFRDDGAGHRFMGTLGAMVEERSGGGTPPGSSEVLPQALESRRVDGGFVWSTLLRGGLQVDARTSAARTAHAHRPGALVDDDVHSTVAAEGAVRGTTGGHTWVVGGALEMDRYRSTEAPGFNYQDWTPGVFVQDEVRLGPLALLSVSARLDRQSRFGTFLSPRASLLVDAIPDWTARLSWGTGFHAPTPFTEETEEVGLLRLNPLEDLEAERARTLSGDLGWARNGIEANATLFASTIRNAVTTRPDGAGMLTLTNLVGDTRTWGSELLVRVDREPFVATLSHTRLYAREPAPGGTGRREVPLTPRDQVGIVTALEQHGTYRLGVEVYYVGAQELDDNPWRSRGEPYWMVGVQGERRFGSLRVFVNMENLTDTRQTRYDPVLRPSPNAWGRWTTEVWAPLEGRVINAGIRLGG